VLGIDHAYNKEADNAALTVAKAMLAIRGNTPRLFQNTLVFLAIDQIRLQDLDEAVRRYLAWESIVTDAESGVLELTMHQIKQAKEQKETADGIVAARLPEAYQWLLVATQASPQSDAQLLLHILVAGKLVQPGNDEICFQKPVSRACSFELVIGQNLKRQMKATIKLILPLLREASWTDNKTALEIASSDELLNK
jgi:hypothetical protein